MQPRQVFALARVSLASLSLTSLSLTVAAVALAGCRETPPPAPSSAGQVTSGTSASASATATGTSGAANAAANGELAVGKPAPAFVTKDQDGKDLSLAALKGKPVVVYFYPKDETPGCTKEACAFRDAWKDLEKRGVVLIGVSTDTADSHKAFAKHHSLPFLFASDENGTLAKAFGVPNNGGYLGRQTFVIGSDGNLKKIYRDVDVTKHAAEVLADVGP